MSELQDLLDKEAALGNAGFLKTRLKALEKIKLLRGDNPPVCHGQDDCSTQCLMVCPWRIDCGTDE
jgi:hypothetical protein